MYHIAMLCRVLVSFPVSFLFLQVLPSSPPAVERKSLKGREEKSDAPPRQQEVRDLDDELLDKKKRIVKKGVANDEKVESSASAPKKAFRTTAQVLELIEMVQQKFLADYRALKAKGDPLFSSDIDPSVSDPVSIGYMDGATAPGATGPVSCTGRSIALNDEYVGAVCWT